MELLIVISIISLLLTMLVPSLNAVMEMARRAKCAKNLNGIATGLAMYETEHESYPFVPLNGAGWGVKVGSARDVNPFAGGANGRNPSSCLYLLVRTSLCSTGLFVCPSAREVDRPEFGAYWDFVDGKAFSYALMNPYGPHPYFNGSLEGSVPILADGSPYFDPLTGLRNSEPVVDLPASVQEKDVQAGNSPNHARRGQLVAVLGGSTCWQTRVDVGCNRDNIYSRADKGGTDGHGSIPAPGGDGSAQDQGPAGPRDSYLVP